MIFHNEMRTTNIAISLQIKCVSTQIKFVYFLRLRQASNRVQSQIPNPHVTPNGSVFILLDDKFLHA